ncbi:MAG TPA: hypothetical protein VKT76_07480 [Bradyrhizobium sp.]|nr:hypothetical protein [Bradyrhizobium sp.]
MISKAGTRLTLILVTGLFVFCESPVQAQIAAEPSITDSKSDNIDIAPAARHKNVRHGFLHGKNYRHRKPHGMASRADTDRSDRKTTADTTAANNKARSEIPTSIANANAQLLLAGMPLNTMGALPAKTETSTAVAENTAPATGDEAMAVVAADQLNDVDRSLHENSQPAPDIANSPPASAMSMAPEITVWDHTSLIGKIFIGFGTLLTMASAARMFMA